MASHKDTFQDRVGRAAEAKKAALESLKAKPPLDEALIAERLAAREAREAKDAEKRAAKKLAEQTRRDEKAAAMKAKASVPPPAPAPVGMTEAEKKAARDERYAARKNRK